MSSNNQLNNLLTYTTFHIGVYVTLAGAFITAGTQLDNWWFKFSAFFITLAGISGGTIGSNVPDFDKYEIFLSSEIGFFGIEFATAKTFIRFEHAFFWIAVLPIVIGYVCGGPSFFLEPKKGIESLTVF